MVQLTLFPATFGTLPIQECRYRLGTDIDPMDSFARVFLHNTYKHTDLAELLDYSVHQRQLAGIGYHFTIGAEGIVSLTRPLTIQGAHVYGRNRNSVGIGLLNVDACAASPKARESFRRLYAELQQRSTAQPLSLFSHTFGQFEYLRERTQQYNALVEEELQVPEIAFDQSVCELAVFQQKADEANSHFWRYRRDHPIQAMTPQFRELEQLVARLKICPGPQFRTFAHEVGIKV